MLYAIHCFDHPDKLQTRLDNYDDHRAYLNSVTIPIVLAGPLDGDDEKPIGSLVIVDAKDRAEAEAFNQGDPFYKVGVWDRSTINIHRYNKRRGWVDGF